MKTPRRHPPRIASKLLEWMLDWSVREQALGDFEEQFYYTAESKGLGFARIYYWLQILPVFKSFLCNSLYEGWDMFKNYIKIAIRVVFRNKIYSFVNIAGLTIGMTCVVLLLLWIQDELSYDKFHKKIDDIYIVAAQIQKSDLDALQFPSVPGMGPLLEELFPEVKQSARFLAGYRTFILSYDDRTFSEQRVFPADPEVLEMFTFPLIEGNPKTALKDPFSLVLSERIAKKYFGDENPVGKIITLDNQHPMKVTGVMNEVPDNSTFHFNILVPLEFYVNNITTTKDNLRGFSNQNYFVFVELEKAVSVTDLNAKIEEFVVKKFSSDEYVAVLCPFARFHLYGLGQGGGNIEQIRLIGFLAAFILFIACINFMNLTTARSGKRSKEIGVRKVIGAFWKDIVKQFYFETLLLVLISMVLTVFLARLFLPVFNTLFRKELTLNFLQNPTLLLFFIGTSLVTVLVAGSYPALFMSSFEPLQIIKGFSGLSIKRSSFRRALVVIQFTLAIGLIAGAAGVYKQLTYLQKMDLGYNMENLVLLSNRGELRKHCDTVKNEFLQIPGVSKVTNVSHYLIGGRWNTSSWQWEGKDPAVKPNITNMSVDSDFLETFEIPLVKGRFFRKETDYSGNPREILINEKLAGIIGAENPLGVRMSYSGRHYTVIGVIKNFIPNPRWRDDEPLVLFQMPERYRYILLKVDPNQIPQTLSQVQKIYERLNPGFPFEYDFMDATYEIQFNFVRRTRSLIAYLAIFAVFISCLGLFGLASFNAEQRTKEIGIRKVLGSSVLRIVTLLSKDLTVLVLLANLIAWPVAWYLLNQWLQDFLFRTKIDFGLFVLAGVLALIIALLTVSFQSIRAALTKPVESLRYE
jgi:putative ABC transport system permease protein